MADESNNTPQQDPNNAPRIMANGQYVKDLSFENPGAPGSLFTPPKDGKGPKVDVNVDLKAGALNKEKGLYEVVLKITAKTEADGKPLFIAELAYGGAFTLLNVPEGEVEPTLLIYCAGILFPYARRILSDTTRDGGFAPLMLDPVDFASLYMQRKQRENAAQENAN